MQPSFINHILLFHNVTFKLSSDLSLGSHNVNPTEFEKTMIWYSQNYQMVFVDDLITNPSKKGRCAVTFDDGYSSVFSEALPILKQLRIPATIYLNSINFDKKVNWRDRIRYLMSNGLVDEFLSHYSDFAVENEINVNNFYSQTKTNRVPSRILDELLTKYFENTTHLQKQTLNCVCEPSELVESPLVKYGNHSNNHYLLSSLTGKQQLDEIAQTKEFLDGLGLPISRLFSIPFGGTHDFNTETLSVCSDLGYAGVLLSRDRMNIGPYETISLPGGNRVALMERYQAQSTFGETKSRLPKIFAKSLVSTVRRHLIT